jgi:hypothetical protein
MEPTAMRHPSKATVKIFIIIVVTVTINEIEVELCTTSTDDRGKRLLHDNVNYAEQVDSEAGVKKARITRRVSSFGLLVFSFLMPSENSCFYSSFSLLFLLVPFEQRCNKPY